MNPLPLAAHGGRPAAAASYRPEIDGLRAIAIAAVVINHAFPDVLPGGFAGVDVFFVISGYLITTIIAGELAMGRFSLWQFWQRRIRRIVPALAAMLTVSALAAWAVLTPEDFYQFSKGLAAAALFGSNLLFARDVDYFDTAAGYEPLIHTWTLGVEEQFYLVFPLLMLGIFRWRRGALLAGVGGITLASFVLALWLAPRWPLGAFYLLPTRIWELGIGALVALVPPPLRARGMVAVAGLALMVAGFFLIGRETPAPGPWFALPVIGTALVIRHGQAGTMAARMLGWRGVAGLGLVSFGVYLWHQPLLALGRYLWFGGLAVWSSLALIALSVGLGAASWRWIEQPVRRQKVLPGTRALVMATAAMLALPVLAGVAGYARLLLPASGHEAARLDGLKPGNFDAQLVIPPKGPLAFVLYGDSHASQYYTALTERFGPGALISQWGCLAADNLRSRPPSWMYSAECNALPGQLASLLRERGVRTVIWAQRWERDLYPLGSGTRLGTTTEAAGAKALMRAMKRFQAQLPHGTRIILIGNSPTAWAAGERFAHGWLRCRAAINTDCPPGYPATLAEGRAISARLKELAEGDPGFAYVDPKPALCSAGQCWFVQDGTLNYWDGSHLTLSGARRVAATIDPALLRAQPAPPAILP